MMKNWAPAPPIDVTLERIWPNGNVWRASKADLSILDVGYVLTPLFGYGHSGHPLIQIHKVRANTIIAKPYLTTARGESGIWRVITSPTYLADA